MKEALLQFIWERRLWPAVPMSTVSGQEVVIEHPGTLNTLSGPDFLNGRICIGGISWAGNIEIHLRSSLWYQHTHERDPAYNNVILHVVWEHDMEVITSRGEPLETLELRSYIPGQLLATCEELLEAPGRYIPCERLCAQVIPELEEGWTRKYFRERSRRKLNLLERQLHELKGDWESLLYRFLLRAFGSLINGEAFFELSARVPFKVFRCYTGSLESMEALLFGGAGMLDGESGGLYGAELSDRFGYLSKKHGLRTGVVTQPLQYFRLRPSNFPGIRLSQFASLYHTRQSLFARLMEAESSEELIGLLKGRASVFWDSHYTLNGNPHTAKVKRMSAAQARLLLINVVLPLRQLYGQQKGCFEEATHERLMRALPGEVNNTIQQMGLLGFPAGTAWETQGVLELYQSYCCKRKCLHCHIGHAIMDR